MNKYAENTFRAHGIDLDSLMKTTNVIEHFFIGEAMDIEPHISSVTDKKYSSKNDLSLRSKRCIDLVNLENTMLNIFPNLWEELGEAIRNLIISNYRSVYRSLRWIIESTVFWANMELNKKYGDAKDHFNNYYHNVSMSKENISFLSEYVIHYNLDLINEHLHWKEKYGKPQFKETVNNLTKLTKDENVKRIISKIRQEIESLYHDFSAFTHISIESYTRNWDNPDYYPYSTDYVYTEEKFYSALEVIWKVIDLITSIMLLVCSRFYGYNLPHEYLEAMKNFKPKMYKPSNVFIKHVNSMHSLKRAPTVFSLL